jgi:hypothetical protein
MVKVIVYLLIYCCVFGIINKYPKLSQHQLTAISFILPIQAVCDPVAQVYFFDAIRIDATGIVTIEEKCCVDSGITSKLALCITRYQHSVLALDSSTVLVIFQRESDN